MDRYTLLIDNAMISDKKGDWVHYKDAAARIAALEAQLSAAQERIDELKVVVTKYETSIAKLVLILPPRRRPNERP